MKKVIYGVLVFVCFISGVGALSNEEGSNIFKKIAPNDTLRLPVYKMEVGFNTFFNLEAHEDLLEYIFGDIYDTTKYHLNVDDCNENKDSCFLNLFTLNSDGTLGTKESRKVTVKWAEVSEKSLSNVESNLEHLNDLASKKGMFIFDLNDLSLINFYKNLNRNLGAKDFNNAFSYLADMDSLFAGTGITLIHNSESSSVSKASAYSIGASYFLYDGIYYYLGSDFAYTISNVIYVSEETANDGLLAAAKERLDGYLGKNNYKLEVGGKIKDYYDKISENGDNDYGFANIVKDLRKTGEDFYNLTIGGVTVPLVIVRDSGQFLVPRTILKDELTGLTISSSSVEMPLDAEISVKELDFSTADFKEINEVLKMDNSEELQIYDIELFSRTLDGNVKRFDNGEVKVSIPIKKSLFDRELYAYYVDDAGNLEYYPVTVSNGIGTFTTKHFSIYTIGLKKELSNSKTEDNSSNNSKSVNNIYMYVGIGAICLVALIGILVFIKRKN